MAGRITTTGSGRLTPNDEDSGVSDDEGSVGGWSATEAVPSVAIGQPPAGTGAVTFSGAVRDEVDGHYSEWAIDQPAVFLHSADSEDGPELGSYPGTIAEITTQGGTSSGTVSSILSLLNAERLVPTRGEYTAPSSPYVIVSGVYLSTVPTEQAIAFSPDGDLYYVQYAMHGCVNPVSQDVYLSDSQNNLVWVYSSSVVYITQFGSAGSGNGQFDTPGAVAFSPDGQYVYVADIGNYRIQRFNTSTYAYDSKWGSQGTGNGQFSSIAGMAADGFGNIYVVDSTQKRVQKFSATGSYLGSYYPQGQTALRFPYALAYDGRSMYVSDLIANVIHRFNPETLTFQGTFGSMGTGVGQTLSPRALAVNPATMQLVVADVGVLATGEFGNNRVVSFDIPRGDYAQPLSGYYKTYLESCIPWISDPVGDPLAINYVQVPRMPDISVPNYGWYVSSPSANGGRGAPGTGVDGGRAYFSLWTASDNDPDTAIGMGDSNRISLGPDVTITPSVYARFVGADATRAVQMHVAFYDISNSLLSESVVGSATLTNSAAFVRLIGSEITSPADTDHARIFLTNPDAATFPWDAGDKLYLDRMSTWDGDYFDALSESTTGLTYVWDGLPWASPSVTYATNYVYAATSDPLVAYPGFRGNVWAKLNELAQANAQEIAVINGVITVRDIMEREVSAEMFAQPPTISVNTQGLARSIDIVYQNIEYGDGVVMYDAQSDNNRIFQIAAGKKETFTIALDDYPVFINNPVPTGTLPIGPGQYYVSGSDNLPVVAQEWLDYGGNVEVEIGDNPNEINITLTGPLEEIPGVPGPYYLAASDGQTNYATLSVTGAGVKTNPRTLHLHTGADPDLVTEEVGTTVTNIFIDTEAQAYDRGVWASDLFTGPNVTLSGDLDLAACEGFGLTPGSWIRYADSKYRIETVNPNNARAGFTARRHVTSGDEADLWSNLPEITNLSENPSIETNTTDFAAGGGLAAMTRSGDWAASGDYSLRLSANSNSDAFAAVGNAYNGTAFLPWSIEAGHTYTISADMHSAHPGGGSWLTQDAGKIAVYYHAGTTAGLLVSSDPLDEFTTDAHVAVTFTVPQGADGLRIEFWATGIGTGWYAYWDAFMLTEGGYDWPFFDGNTSGASWLGTANNSASTKAPDTAGDYAVFWNGEPAKNAIIRPLRAPGG